MSTRDRETRLTPAFIRELEAVFAAAKGRLPLATLEALIRRHLLPAESVLGLIAVMPALLDRAARVSIEIALASGVRQGALDLGLPAVNRTMDEVVGQIAARESARMVTQVSIQQRMAISRVVQSGAEFGLTVRDQARLIRQVVGLTDGQALAVLNFQARLVKQGMPAAAARAQAQKYAARLLRQRSMNIARTENIFALSRGQDEMWKRAQRQGLLRSQAGASWQTADDERVCRICGPMHGQVRRIGEPYITPAGVLIMHPPAHPSCRCTRVIDAETLRLRRAA